MYILTEYNEKILVYLEFEVNAFQKFQGMYIRSLQYDTG